MKKVQIPILEVSNITKKTKKAQLEGVSITVPSGDSLAILCKNDDICDVMFDVLSGAIKPEKGKVFFKGDNVTGTKNNFGTVARKISVSKRKTVIDAACAPIIKRGLARSMTTVLVKKELPSMGLEEYGDKPFSALPDNIAARGEVFAAYMCSHELIVINEPFADLSGEDRKAEIARLCELKNSGKLSLLVCTNDIDTAIELGDTIMAADDGLKSNGMIAVCNNKKKAKERLLELYL